MQLEPLPPEVSPMPMNPAPGATEPMPLSPAEQSQLGLRADSEHVLSISVLVFTLLVLMVQAFLMRKSSVAAESVLPNVVVTMVVGGTLFALAASFSAQQLATATGLFGAIVGYLLGKTQARDVKDVVHKDGGRD